MLDILVFSAINLIFLLVGYFAGQGSLQEKVKKILSVRNQSEGRGVVKPLSPQDLDRKRSKEIMDRYVYGKKEE